MAKFELLLPKMGESVAEATVIKWLKQPGDRIEADDAVVEIATDKVDSEVPSPVNGVLKEQLVKQDDVVQVGTCIAVIETVDEPESQPEKKPVTRFELLLPKMGESVAEATLVNWLKQPGDQVTVDDAIVMISTDKVDSELPSPVNGTLVEHLFKSNDIIKVGTPIAVIETTENNSYQPSASTGPKQEPPMPKQEPKAEPEQVLDPEPVPEMIPHVPGLEQLQSKTADQTPPATQSSGIRFYSPLVRNIANQESIGQTELDAIPGTGAEGRLTKDDLMAYLQNRGQAQSNKQEPEVTASPSVSSETTSAPTQKREAPQQPAQSLNSGDEIIEMDRMRRLIADHMVMSRDTSAHVTSFVEADVTNLVYWREKVKGKFEKREGQKLTFTPIFIEAVARAIVDMPMINVSVNGTQIIKKKDVNIGMATALPNGNLIVPVIRRAERLNLTGLAKSVNDLANRARNNKLQPDDTRDGTFTITNIGMFGNIMGTPIINQPQVAILAVGTIKKKPAVIETPTGDVIAIRHMMYLSLSYDHRVVDGGLGGSFVKRVADYLENWDLDRDI
jgi:2-oxoglutarate dehydrogenase E2 component (dihydrolipoamide succinyltransferase)